MKHCLNCVHEPEWERPSPSRRRQGTCSKLDWPITLKREECYADDCQLVVCPDWEAKAKGE